MLVFERTETVTGVVVDDPMLTPETFLFRDTKSSPVSVPTQWEGDVYYWVYAPSLMEQEYQNARVYVGSEYIIVQDKKTKEHTPYKGKTLEEVLLHYNLKEHD